MGATPHGTYNSEAYFRGGTCSLRVGEHPWKLSNGAILTPVTHRGGERASLEDGIS